MDQLPYIDQHLKALKSTYPLDSKFIQGIETEFLFIKKYLHEKYHLVSWRKKYFGVEMDLLFRDVQQNLYFLECKTIKSWEWGFRVISERQRIRLNWVRGRFINQWPASDVGLGLGIRDLSSSRLEIVEL